LHCSVAVASALTIQDLFSAALRMSIGEARWG